MREFSFTDDKLPAYVRKCRDTGERHYAVYIPAEGLTIAPDGVPYAHPSITWYVTYPRDGAGRLVLVLAVRDDDTPDRTRWFYGWASGCGYDKLSAAADMGPEGPVFRAGPHRWTLRDHCPYDDRDDVQVFQLSELRRHGAHRLADGSTFLAF